MREGVIGRKSETSEQHSALGTRACRKGSSASSSQAVIQAGSEAVTRAVGRNGSARASNASGGLWGEATLLQSLVDLLASCWPARISPEATERAVGL